MSQDKIRILIDPGRRDNAGKSQDVTGGDIIGHLNVSATIDAGIAQELALGPIIATTLSWEMRRCATVRA